MRSMFYKDGMQIDGLPTHTYREEQEGLYNMFFNEMPQEIKEEMQKKASEYYKLHFAEEKDKGFPKDLPVVVTFRQVFADANLPIKNLGNENDLQNLINDGFDFNNVSFDMQIINGTKSDIPGKWYDGCVLNIRVDLISKKDLNKENPKSIDDDGR